MSINIMEQYIELTKKQINAYMRLVFGNKFNKKYCDLYTEKYINVRYYNFYEEDITNTIRKKIINHLKLTEEDIIVNNINDRELIEKMCVFYYYILYFDNVVYYKDLQKKIEKIAKMRKKLLNKKTKDFEKNLHEKMADYINQKEELLKRFETEDFNLKISNYPDKLNIYRVNLKYNISFPPEYSNYALDKAFTTGVIDEDRLSIEYYLITIQILKDIIKQNFKRHYIVEFSDTILKKSKKLKSLLKIINNGAIQDKLSLKIRYEHFLANKEKIYELMQQGYRITVVLDNSFDASFKNLENLNMFKYVIINKNIKQYEEIIKLKNVIKL